MKDAMRLLIASRRP